MLQQYAEVRRLKRWIYTVPVMTAQTVFLLVVFITSTSYSLAINLVDSMKIDVVAKPNSSGFRLGNICFLTKEANKMAFDKIKSKMMF